MADLSKIFVSFMTVILAVITFAAQGRTEPPTKAVFRDLIYHQCDGESLYCDVYLPEKTTSGLTEKRLSSATARTSTPVLVMVPGGGWTISHKFTLEQHARLATEFGMAAVTICYRHAPKHPFPAQVDDLRHAIHWVQSHSDRFGFDPQRLGLYGYSAGGHLASLIGVLADEPLEIQCQTSNLPRDSRLLRQPFRPRAIVAGGPPTEFREVPTESRVYAFFLGGTRQAFPEVYAAASPMTHLSSGDVPTFYYHGTEDLLTSYGDTKRLCERQHDLGVDSHFVSVEKKGHLLAYIDWQVQDQAMKFLADKLLHEPTPPDRPSTTGNEP